MPSSSWSLSSSSLVSSSLGSKLPGSGLQNRKLSFLATRNHRPWHICCYYCCWSVAKSCPTHCDPMDCSTPGFPVIHYLLECAQIHVHWVSDAIHPSHPLLPSSPLAFNLSQHQGLFQWVSSSHQVAEVFGASASASVLPMNINCWFPLGLTGLISLLSKRLSRLFSSPTAWKHQFFGAQLSLWSTSHIHTWLLEKP